MKIASVVGVAQSGLKVAEAGAVSGLAGGFAALLAQLGLEPGAATSGQAGTPAGSAGGGGTATGQATGVGMNGGSAAELVSAQVQLAAGLRQIEAEALQGVKAALAQGDTAKAQKIVQGTADAIGSLLGAADDTAATTARAALQSGLDRLSPDKSGDKQADSPTDPLAQLEGLFGWLSSALGLARPQATPPAAAASAAPDATPTAVDALAGKAAPPQHGQEAVPLAQVQAATAPTTPAQPTAATPPAATADPALAELARRLVSAAAQAPSPDPSATTTPTAAQGFFGLVPPGAARTDTPSDTGQSIDAPKLSAYVTNQIKAASVSGDRATVSLKPQGLGDVEIEVKRDDSGKLSVVVRAENPLVLSALQHDQDRLSAAITGLAAQGSSLEFQDMGGRQTPQQNPRRTAAGGVSAVAEDEDTAATQTIGQGRIDIRT